MTRPLTLHLVALACLALACLPGPAAAAGRKAPALSSGCDSDAINASDAKIESCRAAAAKETDPRRASMDLASICDKLILRFSYDEAMKACNRAVALAPDLTEPYSNRGKVYGSIDRPELAIADFTRAMARESDPIFDLYQRADAWRRKGDLDRFYPERASSRVASYDHAIADAAQAKKLAEGRTGDARAWADVVAGFAGTAADESKAAKQKIANGQKPVDPRVWCEGKGVASDVPPNGYYDDVIAACTLLIRSGRDRGARLGHDHFLRGRAHDQENMGIEEQWRAPLAIPDYQRAIDLGADAPEANRGIGSIYADAGDSARALPYLDIAVAANDAHLGEALAERGKALGALGRHADALKDLDRALELKPDDMDALLVRGGVYVRAGRNDDALADCAHVLRLTDAYPQGTSAQVLCGKAKLMKADYPGAIASYDKALSFGGAADAYYERGTAKLKSGDKTGQADIDQAVKLDSAIAAKEAKLGIAP